jgi:cytochrome c biogenesis protein CcdA
MISVFSCACNFAIFSSIAGYSGVVGSTGKTKTIITSSIFFLLGIVLAMSIIGCVIGYAGGFFIATLGDYWKIGAGIIFIIFGIYILDILPFKIPGMSFNFQNKRTGIIGTILFGIMIGGFTALSNICCNPIYPIVIATIFVKGNLVWGLVMLFFYSFGYGGILALTMLGAGLGVGKISNVLSKFAKIIKYAGGITLIIFGFYFLLTF